jgi:site-specific recombinase XerD
VRIRKLENGVRNILQKFSIEDIEKLKILLSIVPETTQKEVVTLRVFVEEYSNLIKQNRSNAYYKSVENAFKHFTDFFGNQRAIQSLGLKDIENFISHLQKKVTRGYRVYVRTLKAAFSKAVDWGYVKENCFFKVKLPKKQQVNPAFMTSEQLAVISKKIENKTIKDLVTFAFYTGMRLNEIVNLTWRNVDLSKKIITVGDEEFTTKGRNQRYIPICEEVCEALLRMDNVRWLMVNEKREKKYPSTGSGQAGKSETRNERSETQEARGETRKEKSKKQEAIGKKINTSNNTPRILRIHPSRRGECKSKYVFCKINGERFTGDYVSKTFKQACKDAGIDKSIHFHSLRHSFASNLAQSGVSLYTIKELLGHSSIATTEIYSHLNMDSLKDAIRVFDASTSLSTGYSTSLSVTPHPKSFSSVRRRTSESGG